MNTIILQGSPRKKGNTATVLGWIEEELKTRGHGVESIYLNGKDIRPCLACAKCKEVSDEIGCVQKDDGLETLKKMVDAELVIFASPLYFWGVTAQLKALIDRTYSLYTNYHKPDHASLVEGQRQAFLMTGGGPYENNAEAAFTAFDRLLKPHKSVKAGELFIGGCSTPENIPESVKAQAVEFARRISS